MDWSRSVLCFQSVQHCGNMCRLSPKLILEVQGGVESLHWAVEPNQGMPACIVTPHVMGLFARGLPRNTL